MALITRISKLFTADVHAVLDRIEEPEVVLKQAVREMTEEVTRTDQRLRWLATEQQPLERQMAQAEETITSLDEELDLCFEANEDALARSLVKRKLQAQQKSKQASHQLVSNQRDIEALEAVLAEHKQQLADMRQKVDILVETESHSTKVMCDLDISQDTIDVAFLKEKQRRQS